MRENNIDFIGDIHGHAEKLKLLLSKLGYENSGDILQRFYNFTETKKAMMT